MSDRVELSRRSLLKVVGGVGACFVLGSFSSVACATPKEKAGVVFAPNAFIKLAPDGTATVTITRSDMGQGVRTSLAMLVAEEMDLDWNKVVVIQATADPKLFGGQGTGGSGSIRGLNQQMRKLGAGARHMLIAAAAKDWGVDPSTCHTERGHVISATGKSVAYADLTALASTQIIPTDDQVKLKDPANFTIVGKPTLRVDNPAVVTGQAIYGLDVKVDNMAYAVIARPPGFGAKLKAVDDTEARKVPGVIDIIRLNGVVAVIAKHTWAAISGRDALKLDWDGGPNPDLDTAKISAQLKGALIDHLPMPAGAKLVEASLDFPFLAHATMEPMNAVANVNGDRCEVWTGTQVPDSARSTVARILNVPGENVTINTTLLGGGFGRRLFTDFIGEAVQVSKAAKLPIKLVWTREDDMRNDHYRGATHCSIKGAVDATGKPVAWSHQAIQAGERNNPKFGGADMPYEIKDAGLRFSGISTPIPTGPWRSVENTVLNVMHECFIDEMAHAAGKDPVEFRLALIGDERLKNVLSLAAKKAGWGTPLPKGHGRGIACFSGYGSYAAHVIEASVEQGKVKVHRVVAVIDCGLAINPKGVEAQIQGACVDGLSTSLRAEITIDKGGVVQGSWPDYKWMTMDAMPHIEVTILQGDKNPGGMGEVGYPSVPPALANAVFAATGKRVRKFPIKIAELA